MTKPLASPKPLVAKPLPSITADQQAANARTLKGLQNLSHNGDLPDYFARPLRDTAADKGVVAEYKDFMGQLKTADPKRASGFHKEVMGKLAPATQAKIAPYGFDKAAILQGGAGKDTMKPPTAPKSIAAMDDAGLVGKSQKMDKKAQSSLEKVEWNKKPDLQIDSGTLELDVDGPLNIQNKSVTFGADGMEYEVDWWPLDKNGTVVPTWETKKRPHNKGGGLVFYGYSEKESFQPPFESKHGYRVKIRIPPQPAYHGNSSGVYLNIHAQKGQKVRRVSN